MIPRWPVALTNNHASSSSAALSSFASSAGIHAWAHAVHASIAQTAHRQGRNYTEFVALWMHEQARVRAIIRTPSPPIRR